MTKRSLVCIILRCRQQGNHADLQQRRVIARDYRNRRIGDFLKELKLTEGKATGFPVISDEMKKNGNSEPVFIRMK